MGGFIDMNVCGFWEISASFLKSVVLQYFPEHTAEKLSFPLRIYSVNMTKSAANLVTFTEVILHFLCNDIAKVMANLNVKSRPKFNNL